MMNTNIVSRFFSNASFRACVQALIGIVLIPVVLTAQQQPTLQISAPASGAIVAAGQNLTVGVTSPSGSLFSEVDVLGDGLLGMIGTTNTVPAQLSFSIPPNLASGSYTLTAEGVTTLGQTVVSSSITIDVERSDAPLSISSLLSTIVFQNIGDSNPAVILATFADGSVVDVSESSYLTYTSSNTSVATVDTQGMVTSTGYGNGLISAVYSNGGPEYEVSIPVNAQSPLSSATPAAWFLSVTPGTQEIPVGSNANFTVSTTSYSGFTGTVTAALSSLPSGLTASFSPLTIVGSGSSTLSISSSAAVSPGHYLMTLLATDGNISPSAQIELILDPPAGAPEILTVNPISGTFGTPVTIWGTNFGSTQGSSTASFGGMNAPITLWSNAQIVAGVPNIANGNVSVVVTVGGQASNSLPFNVAGVTPSITAISPTSGAVGTPVTVTGTNFGSAQGTSTMTFNGIAATPTSWTATSIVVPVPSVATTGNVVVTAGGVPSNGLSFTVTSPSISNLSPTSGGIGTVVTISGTNFGLSQGTSTVTFNGTAATPTSWSATSIVAPVPSGASTGNVLVTVGGSASNGVSFTVSPSIVSLSQNAGAVGTPVTITGLNFGSTQSSSTVTFNGIAATPTSWGAASIVVPVPSGATTGNVVVTVGGVSSNGVNFTVLPTPNITSLNPSSGAVGTSVTITGVNFGSAQGTSTVTFGGTAGTPTSWTGTSIVVPVPTGATSGNVVVTVGGQASSGIYFNVVAASIIKLVQHASKDAGTTTSASLAFSANNTAGNWIGVCISAGASGEAFTVTDSSGNEYVKAIQFNETGSGNTLGIFYAEKIAGGANTITVADATSAPLRFAIFEYSGIVTWGSLDGTTVAQGNNGSPNSGNITTNANSELLLGTILTGGAATFTAGSGYTAEESVPAAPNTRLLAEDQIQTSTGTVSASATLNLATNWAAGLATFKGAPSITSVNPTSGIPGTVVTMNGSNFDSTASQGNGVLTFTTATDVAKVTANSWSSTSIVAPVPTSATTGNVVVSVQGATSDGVNFTVLTGGIHLVQSTSKDAGTTTSSSLPFTSNNTAGNFIAVCIRAGHSGQTFTVNDSNGNSYQLASQLAVTVGSTNGNALAIYYAANIAGGANTVTVSDSTSDALRFAIFEYSGVATSSPLDVTASAQGTSSTPSSGNATTTANGDLLLGVIAAIDSGTYTSGTGYVINQTVGTWPSQTLIEEDQVLAASGTTSATAKLQSSQSWGAVLATFKAH